MEPVQAALYILSDAPPGDPLDCVAAAMPLLADRYAALYQVGPDHALSQRALRRAYEPGGDRLLYDFTAPNNHSWAFSLLQDAPAAVLLSANSPAAPTGVLADLRSAQRYARSANRFSPEATVGVLDAAAGLLATRSLPRPAAQITPEPEMNDLALAIAPGAVETAYVTLLGLKAHDANLTILTATRRDTNDLADIIAAFGMPGARVRYVRNREGLVAAMAGVGGLIDVDDGAGSGLSDAAFVAKCLGAPVLGLTTNAGAGKTAEAFARSDPRKDPSAARDFRAARPVAGFANDLHALIEAGYIRARQSAAA